MVPKLDNQIGISVYCTSAKGSGGKIKSSPEQFFVSEVLREKTFEKISSKGNYVVYKLKKRGIDTNHALDDIFKKYGLKLKAFGLKDANASTEQYVCDMFSGRFTNTLVTNRYSLEKIGLVQKPLTKKDTIGNHFKITIEEADFPRISQFKEYDRILNFYGYQRFGSKRPVSHIIGKALLQKKFHDAVNSILAFTSEFDKPQNNSIREMLKDESNYPKVLKEIPFQMDVERIVIEEMIEHSDPFRAIRSIPIQLRRLYVHSFQSYIFNLTLSMAYEDDEDLFEPMDGDVCFDKDDNLGRYENQTLQRLAIPLVGYSYSKKNRFDRYITKILEEQQINKKDFFIKEMQELSDEGGFRQASIVCNNFGLDPPNIDFTLSRGSYATVLLREIIKPMDPIAAGF